MTKYITITLGIILACLAFLPYDYGKMRTHKETRYATMIDTYATHSSHKGNHSYNVRGLFRDKLTGKVFGDSINDSLYRQFERDGNKPIEVSWPYDIDKCWYLCNLVVLDYVGSFCLVSNFWYWTLLYKG